MQRLVQAHHFLFFATSAEADVDGDVHAGGIPDAWVDRGKRTIETHHLLLVHVLGIQAQHNAEHVLHTVGKVAHHDFDLPCGRLHGGLHGRLGGRLHGVWVEAH